MSNVQHANERNFNELITSNKIVLVDFFATWCGPCKMLSPEIERLADEYENKATIVKVDIDEQAGLAQEYGIMSVPTLLIFKDGKIVQQTSGYQPYNRLKQLLEI